MLVFSKLVDETQMSKPPEANRHHISRKLSILLPLRAVQTHSFQYETPCIQVGSNHLSYILGCHTDAIQMSLPSNYLKGLTLTKWPINKFKLVQSSRQQELRGYCPNIYTVILGMEGNNQQLWMKTENRDCLKRLMSNSFFGFLPIFPVSVFLLEYSS